MSNIHKNNLDCKIIEDLLPLYYDGAVNDVTKNAVEDHLNDCEKCKKEYEKYSGVVFTCDEKSTSEEFVSLMKKKRKKQILTIIIASILCGIILPGGYNLLFNAHIKPVSDIEVECAYKYTDDVSYQDKKVDKLFVVYTTANMSSAEMKRHVYEENGKVIYDISLETTVISESANEKNKTTMSLELIDLPKTNTHFPDVDIIIFNGEEIWSEEKNEKDKIPGYIKGWMDFQGENNDEFGNSDSVHWIEGEDYLGVYYENSHREIRWDYDGNVIFDSAEKKKDK
ncbi:MAG: zf-HC2 domain-containing protein [Acutalibacteraceae bacterium]|nr:zf-HC2 domain-containing protein [Acutalibacteraceae bacterium]